MALLDGFLSILRGVRLLALGIGHGEEIIVRVEPNDVTPLMASVNWVTPSSASGV